MAWPSLQPLPGGAGLGVGALQGLARLRDAGYGREE